MKNFIPVLALFVFIVVAGCSEPQDVMLKKINDLEEQENFLGAIKAIETFLTDYPESEYSAEMLARLANLYESTEKDYHKAIALHQELIRRFPDSRYSVQARFMIGYIYANDIKDYDNARKAYNEFLELYPDDELTPSVKWELENLGKDLSEIPLFKETSARESTEKNSLKE